MTDNEIAAALLAVDALCALVFEGPARIYEDAKRLRRDLDNEARRRDLPSLYEFHRAGVWTHVAMADLEKSARPALALTPA